MPQAIKFTSKTKMLIANKIDMPLPDVEAMLDVADEFVDTHGPCYLVFDYPMPEKGSTIPWATMHKTYFENHFEFAEPENESRFVHVNTIATTD